MGKPGKETAFNFTTPAEKMNGCDNKAAKIISPPQIESLKNKKILVAEDIDSNFLLIKFFLSAIGIELIRSVNGYEAVEYCKNFNDINLILMDIKMPVMDGYTATKLIRKINPKIPIIAQTAYAEDRIKAKNYGCNGFISKPFNKNQLISVIYKYI